MRRFHYFLLASAILIIFAIAMAFVSVKNDIPAKHLEIVLRNIGHQLLLHSKDSTSRVLPVTRINENVYQISFENSFGFTPDTLMSIVHQQLARTDLPKDYIVTVNDCHENKTIFAYEINSFNGDLKPCVEREQKMGCYFIQVEFLAQKSFNYAWLLAIFIPVTFVGLFLNRKQNSKEQAGEGVVSEEEIKPGNDKTVAEVLECKPLGKFNFFEVQGTLNLNERIIELTEKETKALRIFASNQNLLVERDRLMKEIWEDEGVLVINRNVDVLVSKLRKKLSSDPSIKIVNVHGKGYKFIV